MFALGNEDLSHRILGCGDGPASFNAGHTKRGGKIVSIDPIYQFSVEEISARIEEARHLIMAQIRANPDELIWEDIRSPEELEARRLSAMHTFLDDFEQGKNEGRYVCAALPSLPFPDKSFGLALCSHFLLHYAEQLDLDFHVASLRELMRVADEVRIYPLTELGAKGSRHADPLRAQLRREGFRADFVDVPYRFIKGANQMLRVRAR